MTKSWCIVHGTGCEGHSTGCEGHGTGCEGTVQALTELVSCSKQSMKEGLPVAELIGSPVQPFLMSKASRIPKFLLKTD